MRAPERPKLQRIILRDTTLREGIQVPGSAPTPEQQCEFVALLAGLGVPEIEIGLPGGTAACADLARWVRDSGLAIRSSALVPCYVRDWRRQLVLAQEHGVHRVDVLAPVSDVLLAQRDHYRLAPEALADRIGEVLGVARGHRLELGVGLMDAARAPRRRVLDLVRALAGKGVSRLVVYDSVGAMVPARMRELIGAVCEASDAAVLVHCHNDYGMATANSLAAVEGGATAVDVAVNGLGGRAGNAALEEVALALEHLYGLPTGIDLGGLCRLSDLAARITGVAVPPLKPVVGAFCFAHLPMMHIRCIAAGNGPAFEPFPPETVGRERTYHFDLPVDYTDAVEPFLRAAGRQPREASATRLVERLRARQGASGWRREEIMDLIARELAEDGVT